MAMVKPMRTVQEFRACWGGTEGGGGAEGGRRAKGRRRSKGRRSSKSFKSVIVNFMNLENSVCHIDLYCNGTEGWSLLGEKMKNCRKNENEGKDHCLMINRI